MKLLGLILLVFSFVVHGQDVYVDGYNRSDGTYVSPHVRSAPDSSQWNNYGRPSIEDRQEQQTDIFQRDYDNDGTFNQYDYDDDNDGTLDDYER